MVEGRHVAAIVVTVCLIAGGEVHSEDDAQKKPQALRSAEQILAVLKKGDPQVLEWYGKLDWPDPWLVALHLCTLGHANVATQLAHSSNRPGLVRLRARIPLWQKAPIEKTEHDLLIGIERAYEAAQWKNVAKRCEAAIGMQPPFVAAMISRYLGQARYELGDLPGALDALRQAERKAMAIQWVQGAAAALSTAGHALRRQDDYEGALEHWMRCVLLHDRREAEVAAARRRGDIAALHIELDDARPAVPLLESSLEVFRTHTRGSRGIQQLLASLQNLGWARAAVGPYSAALAAFEEMHELATSEKRPTATVNAKIGLATILIRMGNWDRAERVAGEALETARKQKYGLGEAQALGTLGLLFAESLRPAEAPAYYERARAAFIDIAYDENGSEAGRRLARRHVATATVNVANALLSMNKLEKAESLLNHVLEEWDSYPRIVIAAREGLGHLRFRRGKYARAIKAYERARLLAADLGLVNAQLGIHAGLAEAQLALGRPMAALKAAQRAMDILAKAVRNLGHGQQARARARRGLTFQIGLAAAAKIDDAAVFSKILESSRAFALLELLEDPERLRRILIPEALLNGEQAAHTRAAAARRRLQQALESGNLRLARMHRKELRAAEEAVTLAVEKVQRTAKAGADLLYPSGASLDLIRKALHPKDVFIQYAMLHKTTYAVVTRATGARIVALGDTEELQTLIRSVIDVMSNQKPDYEKPLQALTARILGPIKLEDVERVMISPDGLLHYVPLATMLKGGDVLYVHSGTTLQRLGTSGKKSTNDILALGNPSYPKHGGLPALPLTETEAREIGTHVLLGSAATETGLAEALRGHGRWRAVHFACHGRLDLHHPGRSHLALSADETSDGRLTCEEVFGMKIPARLVVLSACDTARGAILGAEGLVGLTTAFIVAGSSRTLCSLWKVDDAATAALMTKFYEHWRGGDPMGLALDKARRWVAQQPQWRHPYYWGAWVFWGTPE